LTDADVLERAWSLKDRCYEAWSSAPARAVEAAQALRALADGGVAPEAATEVAALADWTGGIAAVIQGDVARAVDCFDRAATGLRAAGKPDPAAQTQVPKIMALSLLGRHDDAVACALATQAELRALGNLGAAARVSQNLGSLQLFRDAYPEAVRHFREAAVLFARLGDTLHSVLADIGMAHALAAMGDFDEAQRIYARARMRAANQGLGLQQALVDEHAGLLHLARGELRQALAGFEAARRRYETLGLPQYMAVAERLLGDAYLDLRLLPEALALFEAAEARFRDAGLVVEQAWALKQRGLAEALLGRPGAADALAAAAALFSAQGNAVGAAAVALARAELAFAQGDAPAALAGARAVADAYATAGPPSARLRAEVLAARALLALGRVAEAGAAFDATLAAARAQQQLPVQVHALTGQGLVATAAGRSADAASAHEAAIELFETLRAALPGDDLRSAFGADHLRPYQERLRMALASDTPQAVLLQLDRFRARALDERLAEAGDHALDDDERQLRERLNWLHRQVQRLQDEGGAWQRPGEELRRTEHALLERARRRRAAAGPLGAVPVAGGLDLPALQAALGDHDALVEFGVQDDELFACVVTRAGVTLQRGLAPWPRVLDAVRAVRFQIEALRHGAEPVRRHMAALTARAAARLQQLHTLLWAPLVPLLADRARVLLVPLGPLAHVPFAALHDRGAPLGVRHALALAPSARAALRVLQQPVPPAQVALALGESSRLPHAAEEAALVARLFPQGRALVGAQATLAALQQQAGTADVLHLACHAEFRSDNPRFSALHLADGALTVELAERLALRPCTVVLSACETGVAQADAGDEMMGLVRAFTVAGAARVLASLWPVDDAVTRDFMARFYGPLAAGSSPSQALRQAQAGVRERFDHPHFWAAFTLHGGW